MARLAQKCRKILTLRQSHRLVEHHQRKEDLSKANSRSPVGYILIVLGLITCSERLSKLPHAGGTLAVGRLPEVGIE